jgi:hypothetical protein
MSINLTVVSSYKYSRSHPYVSQTPALPGVTLEYHTTSGRLCIQTDHNDNCGGPELSLQLIKHLRESWNEFTSSIY